MYKLVSAKNIFPCLVTAIVFYFLFEATTGYFIKDPLTTPHAIGAHDMKTGKFFDNAFILKAKWQGYDHERFFRSWFLLDLVFPLVYSVLFFCCAVFYRNSKTLNERQATKRNLFYRYLGYCIIAGACMDYGENFSFAFFLLSSNDNLAVAVAFFTAFKSMLYSINMLLALACVVMAMLSMKAV